MYGHDGASWYLQVRLVPGERPKADDAENESKRTLRREQRGLKRNPPLCIKRSPWLLATGVCTVAAPAPLLCVSGLVGVLW